MEFVPQAVDPLKSQLWSMEEHRPWRVVVGTRDLAQVAKCYAIVCPFSSVGQSRTSRLSEP